MFTHYEEIERFLSARSSLGIKPGLERMNVLLKKLGNPEKKLKAIHIAGTNGKGSTVSYLKHALQANGYRVGTFISPSFHGLLGHILIDDDPIEKDLLVTIFNQVYPIVQKLDQHHMAPTEFEIITTIAFLYFYEHADITLIETGMGGRYDTTNSLHPILSIITNVEKDHTTFLGKKISTIAHHKAGIIKKATPVIIGSVNEEAWITIQREANMLQAPTYRIGEDFRFEVLTNRSKTQSFLWEYQLDQKKVTIKMIGEHQIHNASLALMALTILQKKGYKVHWDLAINGLETTSVPGRFEQVHTNPTIILDAAHNVAGINSFLSTVSNMDQGEGKTLILAVFKDKDVHTMLEACKSVFSTIIGTTFNHPRALKWDGSYGDEITICHNWKQLLTTIRHKDTPHAYYITGSLHFIVEVRQYFKGDLI